MYQFYIPQPFNSYYYQMNSYLQRLKTDNWFAFANITLAGIAGYLLIEKLAQKFPAQENEKRILPKLLSKLSLKKQQKKEKKHDNNLSVEAFVDQGFRGKQELIRDSSEFPIYKIVVTGGPCAGKTTAVERVKEEFGRRGFKVMVVPEVPTLLVKSGAMIKMDRFTSENRIEFQKMLIKAAVYLEDHFTRLASMSRLPSIIICDRGTMDPRAYISDEEFNTILEQERWNYTSLRDKRYDEVIFMVTAALGAEKFYTLHGNVARHEGLEIAQHLDRKTLNAWSQHPKLTIVPNFEDETFEDKINRVVYAVQKITGNNTNVRILRYQVKSAELPASLAIRSSTVFETTLINNDSDKYVYEKVEKVGVGKAFSYNRIYGIKTATKDVLETRRPISASEYLRVMDTLKDKSKETEVINRRSFVYKDQFFVLSVRNVEGEEEKVLEITVMEKDEEKVDIPEYIQVERKL